MEDTIENEVRKLMKMQAIYCEIYIIYFTMFREVANFVEKNGN